MTKSDSDADDVLQETFMRIWLSRDQMPSLENLRAWVYTVNARVCLTWLRSKVNQQKKLRHLADPEQADQFTPFDASHFNAVQRIIRQTVQDMPHQRQRIFRMSRDLGKKPADIAEELGIAGITVRNVLVTALNDIRKALASNGYLITLFPFLLLVL